MQLQKESRYGVRMMMLLALHQDDGAIQMKHIAGELGLSQIYLCKIAHKLRKAKLLEGFRGSHGGYRLARRASLISVGELVRCLEDNPTLTHCVTHPEICANSSCCLSRKIWKEAQDAMYRVFDSCTLDMLIKDCDTEPEWENTLFNTPCLKR